MDTKTSSETLFTALENGELKSHNLTKWYYEVELYSGSGSNYQTHDLMRYLGFEGKNLSGLQAEREYLLGYKPASLELARLQRELIRYANSTIEKLELEQFPLRKLEKERKEFEDKKKKLEAEIEELKGFLESAEKAMMDAADSIVDGIDINEKGGQGSRKRVREILQSLISYTDIDVEGEIVRVPTIK